MSNRVSCAVLVSSCDAYADLWRPFFTLWWRHWPDCPWQVFLGANARRYEDPRVVTLGSTPGSSWSHDARSHLNSLSTSHVFLVLEDFFLRERVRTDRITSRLHSLEELDGRMLRLSNRPPPDAPVPSHRGLGRIEPGAPWRVSLQAAFWRRDALLELIREGESIWRFEADGSRRSDAHADGYYATFRQEFPYGHHVVEKGKWFRHEARRFGAMGIGCDFTARPAMNRRESALAGMNWAKARVLEGLPWRVRVRTMALANRLGW